MPSAPASRRRQLHRDFHAGRYLDLFLVSAVSAVLGIRFYLHLTDYPQIGGATLHIAHMLWGGLGMLVAVVLLLSYLGRGVHRVAAFVGGVGFGTFIDEIGKFVTSDNDYFFRPAVALIYVTFVLLYVAVRTLHREGRASPDEYLVNALQEVENVAVRDLDLDERRRALRWLDRADQSDPLVPAIRDVLTRAVLVPLPPPGIVERSHRGVMSLWKRAAASAWFERGIVAFFAAQLAAKIIGVFLLVARDTVGYVPLAELPTLNAISASFAVTDWLQLASALASGAIILAGVVTLRRDRGQALVLFQRSILVSIFATQVFVFYRDEWAALGALAFNIAVLLTLHFMIDHERASRTA